MPTRLAYYFLLASLLICAADGQDENEKKIQQTIDSLHKSFGKLERGKHGNVPSSTEEAERLEEPKFSEDDSSSNETDTDYDDYPTNVPTSLTGDEVVPHQLELNMTRIHAEAKMKRIRQIREAILSKLRLEAPPNVSQWKDKIGTYPKHLLKLDNQQDFQMDEKPEKDTFHAKVETILQFSAPLPEEKILGDDDSTIYFPLPLDVSERNLQRATMLVYVATPDGSEGQTVTLVISNALRKNKPLLERSIDLKSGGHWEHIDITAETREWASDEDRNNFGLAVQVILDGNNLAYTSSDLQKDKGRKPLVRLELDTEEANRYRRSFEEVPLSCHENEGEQRCCRYMFVVDFDEYGQDFDFIITPRRYKANYCAGTCPTYQLPPDSTRALIMGYSRKKIQRCCTPTELTPLHMLYMDGGGAIKQGNLPEMTIVKCGCS